MLQQVAVNMLMFGASFRTLSQMAWIHIPNQDLTMLVPSGVAHKHVENVTAAGIDSIVFVSARTVSLDFDEIL